MSEVSIAPQVVAELVEGLARRLRNRTDALLSDQDSWVRTGSKWIIGNATVTLADVAVVADVAHINCDCLLAPACAHRAAVALALPVTLEAATAGAAPSVASPPAPGAQVCLSPEQLAAVEQCQAHCGEVFTVGWRRLPVTLRAGLHADLHRLRVQQLVRADRALTSLLSADDASEQVAALSRLLANLHALAAGMVDPQVVGEARTYRDVGGLRLTALAAEPILTASGYSGVAVTFVDDDARLWTLSRVGPHELGAVAQHYHGGEQWGGLSDPLLVLSRSQLVVSNATASAAARLGGGKQVRAAIVGQWPGWVEVAEPFRVVAGSITGGDRMGLTVDDTCLELSATAARLGAGLATELFGQARGGAVQALARRSATGWELLGLRLLDHQFQPPQELAGVWWPGLDVVERSWLGALDLPTDATGEPDQWPRVTPSVTAVTQRWLERVFLGGSRTAWAPAAHADVAWLRAAGAPFAAELLDRLATAPQVGQLRFDGQWVADAQTLTRAWLALSQY